MLPPLGAALSASVDYQTSARSGPRAPIPSAAVAGTAAITLPADFLNPGRIDVLSLSGQLHLAQGLSIFAETVGGYLKMPRREGESLVDYAHRLADALKSLTPSQRSGLEQSIAQLVRGITLRMLVDLLNNPLGPEAARLNAYLEGAQSPIDRDLAARAVVSSYRQNGAADGILPPPAARPAAVQAAADRAAQQVATDADNVDGRPAASSAPAGAATVSPRNLEASASAPPRLAPSAGPAGQVIVAEGHSEDAMAAAKHMTPSSGNSQSAPRSAAAASVPASVAPNAAGAAVTEAPVSTAHTEASDAARASEVPRAPLANADNPAPASAAAGKGTPVIYDGPALARLAQRVVDDVKQRFLQEVLYQEVAADDQGTADLLNQRAERSRFTPTPLVSPLGAEGEPAVPQLQPTPGQAGNRPGDTPAHVLSSMSAEAAPLPPQAADPIAKSVAAPLVPDAATLALAAPMLAREGLTQPLIAYPPHPQPPEEEERDVERVSAIDDEGGERHSQQDARKDDHSGEDEGSGSDGRDDAEAERDEDHAQDLYWRMADLT
ncbi:MAG TPA: hypothetical protein VFY63_07735 [Pseudorhizobium sp.]|nr:hypothetical protein [Pseudorhizobium sp.]